MHYINPMRSILRKLLYAFLWLAGAAVLIIGGLFLAPVQPGGSGVLASVRLPDGSEYKVSQRCNWSSEPYTVSFFMRPAGGVGWCYIDHEAMRWRDVSMIWDRTSDSIVVTERGTRRAVLDRKRSAFWIDNGGFSRELAAPQLEVGQAGYPSPP
ncbi:MAG: hypothetical protein JWM59_4362 [Verrucomicrobiales bacterium]|nr:hypothetical protein [Verrucomicrobiales bacterium]